LLVGPAWQDADLNRQVLPRPFHPRPGKWHAPHLDWITSLVFGGGSAYIPSRTFQPSWLWSPVWPAAWSSWFPQRS